MKVVFRRRLILAPWGLKPRNRSHIPYLCVPQNLVGLPWSSSIGCYCSLSKVMFPRNAGIHQCIRSLCQLSCSKHTVRSHPSTLASSFQTDTHNFLLCEKNPICMLLSLMADNMAAAQSQRAVISQRHSTSQIRCCFLTPKYENGNDLIRVSSGVQMTSCADCWQILALV